MAKSKISSDDFARFLEDSDETAAFSDGLSKTASVPKSTILEPSMSQGGQIKVLSTNKNLIGPRNHQQEQMIEDPHRPTGESNAANNTTPDQKYTENLQRRYPVSAQNQQETATGPKPSISYNSVITPVTKIELPLLPLWRISFQAILKYHPRIRTQSAHKKDSDLDPKDNSASTNTHTIRTQQTVAGASKSNEGSFLRSGSD